MRAYLQTYVALPASCAKNSKIAGHPPSTLFRIVAPSDGPMRSKSRCSSSTLVVSGVCATNSTSTSEAKATRESGFHLALISQLTTKRFAGSQTRTWPTTTSLPSAHFVYQRPPTNGSMIDSITGASPNPWALGHQRSIPAVNTSNALAADAWTVMDLRTGAISLV